MPTLTDDISHSLPANSSTTCTSTVAVLRWKLPYHTASVSPTMETAVRTRDPLRPGLYESVCTCTCTCTPSRPPYSVESSRILSTGSGGLYPANAVSPLYRPRDALCVVHSLVLLVWMEIAAIYVLTANRLYHVQVFCPSLYLCISQYYPIHRSR